jgi:serine/threonine-protein kinase
MDADHYARLRRLYDAVVDIESAARADALAQHGADAELAAEVLALCAADDRDRTGALTAARDAVLETAAALQPEIGDVFGAWRIADEIGHGGMGRVYRVERNDGSYAQTAALKFIRGVAGAAAIANFTRERQLLADLNHPNIARLLDGGASAHGQPYLVMEYVAGRPIDEYCREIRLALTAILELFVAACAAVSHAHRQLVVHCDLKPSNILVTAQGKPMLLDFGIAQLAERVAEGVEAASGGATSGYTPGYASPEQHRGERVGVASDIYSLGMVLRAMLDAAKVEAGPELAAIVAMATREDPAARYPSVDALCEDIARLRSHRPLHALPATAAYRLARFVRRNWVGLSIATGIVLVTALFTWKVIAESHRAQAAEQAALAERDRARQAETEARAAETATHETSNFLISVFQGANPDAGSGNVSIATLLDQALQRVDHDLADQPATQAQMSAVLAEILFVIGQHERGRTLYAKAIVQERTQNRPLVLAKMLVDNANTYLKYTLGATPNDDVREAMRLMEKNAAKDSPLRLDLTLEAAAILGDSDPAEAAPLFEQSLDLMRKLKPGSMDLAEVLMTYGWNERHRGEYGHAIALMQEGNDSQLRLRGETDEDYAQEMETIANTMSLARRFDEAGPLFLHAQELHRRYGRMDGKIGAWSLAQYASFLQKAGRAKEALPLYDEIFAIAARKLPADDGAVLVWRSNLTNAAAEAGDLDRAAKLNSEVLPEVRRRWGPSMAGTALVLLTRSRILGWRDCDADGGQAIDEALAIYAKKPPSDPDDLRTAKVQRARWLISCKRFDEAQAQLAEAASQATKLAPMTALQLKQAQALLHLQRDGDAAALAEMQDAEALAAKVYAPGDARIALAKLPRAEWLRAHDRNAEAAALAAGISAGVEGKLVPDSPVLARIRSLRE